MPRFSCTALLAAGLLAATAHATVFLNQIFINPPGSLDDTIEFIELQGTPFMKLDGFAIAFVNGGQFKIHPANGNYPPTCGEGAFYTPLYPDIVRDTCRPEIDEFFSLDGLQLGANGLLVLGISSPSFFSTILSDTNYQRWSQPGGLWNGGLDTPGKLQNDGSNTILLIRNRPGLTQAIALDPAIDPKPPLVWGKDVDPDTEVSFLGTICVGGPFNGLPCNVAGDCPGGTCRAVIEYGNGAIDKGAPDGLGGFTKDFRGALTLFDLSDDLEIVDEVSYEQDRGWEHDFDMRSVDLGSSSGALPERKVHTLDDPQGFNPDLLTRVDYRTKGPGWVPVPGAVGELPNGNNWQDTATEQWIRGETIVNNAIGGAGNPPRIWYSNAPNTNPDAVQLFDTHVPRWLNDGNAPDYDFSAPQTYQVLPGRLNPLAIPFIPGDSNRDGVCDAEDIAKIAAVFGDDDWVFSNSFADAPEGKGGDPATQTRPWDVNLTGDNGIECSDLQWVLNFQGDTTGRIRGVRYDSTAPSAVGVVLNPSAGLTAAVSYAIETATPTVPVGSEAFVIVRGQVLAPNTIGDEQNGIMQFVHDLHIEPAGILSVTAVTPFLPFETTRTGIQTLLGENGDAGVIRVNGYTTEFTAGLAQPDRLYAVTLTALAEGTAAITVAPSAAPNFTTGTPHGLKLGRTADFGNPESVTYGAAVTVEVGGALQNLCPGDMNCDQVVNFGDISLFIAAIKVGSPAGWTYDPTQGVCAYLNADTNADGLVNFADISGFIALIKVNPAPCITIP